MKALIVGGGGREHALAWKLAKQNQDIELFATPGNPGITELGGTCYPDISATNIDQIIAYAIGLQPDLVVIGPEAPLAAGLVDYLTAKDIPAFGPTAEAADLEVSKDFAKKVMIAAKVPTGSYNAYYRFDDAREALTTTIYPIVIKANWLCAGKGVFVCNDYAEAEAALVQIDAFRGNQNTIIFEEFLEGPECSVFVMTDGKHFIDFPGIRDFKRVGNGNTGPNTGGMGSITPIPEYTPELAETIRKTIIAPTLAQMAKRGTPYRGLLYCGLKLPPEGPKVLEFNCRFGDPETQVAMPMLQEDLLDLMMQTIHGMPETRPARWNNGACACIVKASAGYPGKVKTGMPISGLDKVNSKDTIVFHAGTVFNDNVVRTAGGRVVGVTSRGVDLAAAVMIAYHEAKNITFDGAFNRTDIG